MRIDTKSVGLFILLPAPLNPIGAFDAETFKADLRSVMMENPDAKFFGVDLSGLDFVYSDAYNAFWKFHQDLSKRNGTFAVLADRDSLAKSLKKVGLEHFIRIFMNEADMASYTPVEQKSLASGEVENSAEALPHEASETPTMSDASRNVSETQVATTSVPESPIASDSTPTTKLSESKILEKNPLVDEEPSSKGALVVVFLLLLIAAAVVSYLFL